MLKNPLFRLLVTNGLMGAITALALVSMLYGFDLFRLGTLVNASDSPVLVLTLLCGGFIATLCSLMMGSAIMMLPRSRDDHSAPPLMGELIPVRVVQRRRNFPH